MYLIYLISQQMICSFNKKRRQYILNYYHGFSVTIMPYCHYYLILKNIITINSLYEVYTPLFKKSLLYYYSRHWGCRNKRGERYCSYNEESYVIQTRRGWKSFDLALQRMSLKPYLRIVYSLYFPYCD
jgi:hypothetical protein